MNDLKQNKGEMVVGLVRNIRSESCVSKINRGRVETLHTGVRWVWENSEPGPCYLTSTYLGPCTVAGHLK